ncbi:MAG: hypothetical protein WC260_00685 [Candidatus Pacearchaeota archaeon]
MGKLIVIEGTDGSGKQTQSNLLIDKLKQDNIFCDKMSFPNYDSASGKIVGGPYLGKEYISESFFSEGASNVDPLVSCCYFGADRRYSLPLLKEKLNKNKIVILDRYVASNMAHQGGKLDSKEKRKLLFDKLDYFEFSFLELPRPDLTIFLHLPYVVSLETLISRGEQLDGHESNPLHLKNAEETYLQLADYYHWDVIDCMQKNKPLKREFMRSREDIFNELYFKILKIL